MEEARAESFISIPRFVNDRAEYEIFDENIDENITTSLESSVAFAEFSSRYYFLVTTNYFPNEIQEWPNEALLFLRKIHFFYIYIYRNSIIISGKMIDGPDRIECRAIQFE